MAQIIFKWWGDKVAKVGKAEFQRRLNMSAQLLKDEIRRSLNTPWPPASEPGQPPAKRSGLLRSDIDVWQEELNSFRVGIRDDSKAHYAKFLEIGTSIMAARPFLRPALLKVMEKIRRIMKVPISAVVKTHVKEANR